MSQRIHRSQQVAYEVLEDQLRQALASALGELRGSYRDILSFFRSEHIRGARSHHMICVLAVFLKTRLGEFPDLDISVDYDTVTIEATLNGLSVEVTQSYVGTALSELIHDFDEGQLPQLDASGLVPQPASLIPTDIKLLEAAFKGPAATCPAVRRPPPLVAA